MEALPENAIDPIQRMLDELSVTSVFGTPNTEGEHTIIPVADVMYGFGFGFGSAESADQSGGGVGGGGKATPRGFISIDANGVSYTATNNETLIALTGIFTGIWALFWAGLSVLAIARALGRKSSD